MERILKSILPEGITEDLNQYRKNTNLVKKILNNPNINTHWLFRPFQLHRR